jgi:hypothetical protein
VGSVGTPKVDNREGLGFGLEMVDSGETRVGVDKTAGGDVTRDGPGAKDFEINVHELAEGSGGASRERTYRGSGGGGDRADLAIRTTGNGGRAGAKGLSDTTIMAMT